MLLTIEISKKDTDFIAKCKELNIYSYGKTSENAVKRLKKVIKFYIQSAGEYIDEGTSELKQDIHVNDEYLN